MPRFEIAPVGKISQGHVLDVAKGPFERALKDYDPLLYVRWNPKKVRGHGCWEIRRKPEMKGVREVVEFQGMSFVVIEHCELDIVSPNLEGLLTNP